MFLESIISKGLAQTSNCHDDKALWDAFIKHRKHLSDGNPLVLNDSDAEWQRKRVAPTRKYVDIVDTGDIDDMEDIRISRVSRIWTMVRITVLCLAQSH